MHARSVVACGLDGRTGQLFERRLSPDHGDVAAWVRSLPDPVAVTYEAGPTGFGLARSLAGFGIECRVAAPSKLQRPSGDRVKTDVRDARHLARLLHLDEIVAVTVPSVGQEAARDLVRAREDVRGHAAGARPRPDSHPDSHPDRCAGSEPVSQQPAGVRSAWTAGAATAPGWLSGRAVA